MRASAERGRRAAGRFGAERGRRAAGRFGAERGRRAAGRLGAEHWRGLRWWLRLGLRARLVTLGAIGVALALGAGGVGLSALLRYTVDRSVDTEARRTGQEIADLVAGGTLPEPLPIAGGDFVQVVDSAHRVRSASPNADQLVVLLREPELAAVGTGGHLRVSAERFGMSGDLWVVAVRVEGAGTGTFRAGAADDLRGQTVIVARSMADFDGSVAMLHRLLLALYPVFLVVLTVLGWRVAGASLRPVEAMRAEAAAITGAHGGRRLPVPVAADELRNLAVTLNDLLDRLEASRERQRVFVADAAHELRSPLANMRTQIEVAMHLGESSELVDDLLVDVVRMADLVDDLLLLARLDDAVEVRLVPVDVAQVLAEVAERYRGARVAVTVTGDAEVPVLAERLALVRVVTNLVDNAVRHAATAVVMSAAVRGSSCEFTVRDDGPGIAEADRRRVFDRFTRLDDARARDSGGSGLGLAIVRELVVGFGGCVELGDAGPGLLVLVRLPVLDPERSVAPAGPVGPAPA